MIRKLQDLPLKLQQRGFYYGYIVLAAGTLGVVMSVPGQTMGVSVYTDHLIRALGIDRSQLSLAYLFGTVISALLLPTAGKILDKLGARIMAGSASLLLAVFLFLLAWSPNLVLTLQRYSGMSTEWISFAVALGCFLGIRHFGQGQLTMAARTMMGLWFEKKRGLMLGLSGVFVAFGFGISPLVLNKLIGNLGWQQSLHVLAAIGLVFAFFAWSIFRRSPEHCGLEVDGGFRKEPAPELEEPLKEDKNSFTASEAKRTYTFWVFNLGMVGQALIITAVTFHLSNIARFAHISNERAFSVFLPLSFVSVLGDLGGGFLSDRIPLKYLLAAKQLAMCVGLFGIINFDSDLGYALTAGGLGIASGIFALLHGAAWPKLFGRAHLGAIAGIVMAWIVFGSAIGPYLFSLGEDGEGNYKHIIILSMLYPAMIFVASFFANHPKKKD